MKEDKLFSEKEIAHIRPYRLQYSMKEAGYMLDIPADAVKEKAHHYNVKLYTLGPNKKSGKWYIDHEDLVDLHNQMKQFNDMMKAAYPNNPNMHI